MICVFLNNKIIAADTIIPLMLLARESSPDRPIHFYCFDEPTCDALRRNTVLWDAMLATGSFHCMGREKSTPRRWLRRMRIAALIARLSIRSLTGRVHFVHFKALNTGLLRWLARVNWRRTLFVESNCWGHHALMIERVGNIKRQRRQSAKGGAGATIVGFGEEWPEFSLDDNKGKRQISLPSSHLNEVWLRYVDRLSDTYLDRVAGQGGALTPNDRIIVYILGYFGKFDFLRSEDAMLELFHQTMDVLAPLSRDFPVVVKPHIITDRDVVAKAIAARAGNFIVCDLHPAVLASRAVAFVGNYFSTTFADAASFGVPTIEFSDYSDECLAMTENRSMRPEYVTHFINGDREELRETLARTSASRERGASAEPVASGRFAPFVEALAT